MNQLPEIYTDLKGKTWNLVGFDAGEQAIFAELCQRSDELKASSASPIDRWIAFDNCWPSKVVSFYESRGLTRQESLRARVFHLAQDLSNRLAVASGVVGMPRDSDLLRGAVVEPSSAS